MSDARTLALIEGIDRRVQNLEILESVQDSGDLDFAVPALTLGLANAEGAADFVLRSDATILAFDVVVPTTINVGDVAATGAAVVTARRDHLHGIVTSSNPGAKVAILASDANGYLQLVRIGLGIAPAVTVHSYLNDASTVPQVRIEQDGAGDAAIQQLLTGGQAFSFGIDNSDGDKWKLSRGADVSTNPILTITTTDRLGIMEESPDYTLDMIAASGRFRVADNAADTTQKVFVLLSRHYTNAEEDLLAIAAVSNVASNEIRFGGSAGNLNAATQIEFWTAANTTTLLGTLRMAIDSAGNTLIGDGGTTNYVRIEADGDVVYVGGSGIPYGSLYLHEGAVNVDISTPGQGVYVKITGLTTGLMHNVTINADAFNVDYVGVYKIDWQISGDSQGNNKDYEVDIFVNGVEQADGSARKEFGAAASLGSMSGTAIIDVTNTGHDIDLRIKETGAGAGTDFDIFNMNFNVTMVGGT